MKRADTNTLPSSSDLQRELDEQRALVERLQAQLAEKEAAWAAEKRSLFEQIRLLLDNRFGPSTEKYSIKQQDLFFDEAESLVEEPAESGETAEAEEENQPAPSGGKRRRGGRAPLPPELPRVDIVHDLPEDEQQCACGCGALTRIGEEVTEQLDIIPAQIQVLRHVRIKYACRACEDGVQIADLPPQPLPKSNASPGLLAYIATAKYQDALPLYRQEQVFKRLGLELPRNTLARWMVDLGALLAPLAERMRAHLHSAELIHMDETTVQVNTEPGRAASSTSYMWVQRGGPPGAEVVLFDYDPSRSGQVPRRLLDDYGGILLTDGYEGYAQVVRDNAITHAGCWAHARRKFKEAQKVQPKGKTGKADRALASIGKLYRVEREAQGLPVEKRERLRATHSRPLIEDLRQWLDQSLEKVPPKSAIGKAVHYLNSQWPRLIRFLEDGRIPLDNNPAENAIRPFVVGRKNWLFSQTPRGAHASATIYSVIETAKINGLEPYAYLLEVLKNLPGATTGEAIDRLLPWHQDESLYALKPAE
ncbi:IS66 family transposase [Aquisalimonas sp. 2447]|uniref:IS66 family transposase n=1 Tax=Aquisalimonas sp. 2447 TaxID=2740807 RepID=UPI0020C4A227|nr:IS66 family transposase [Aquisalimonas sp. 2447]